MKCGWYSKHHETGTPSRSNRSSRTAKPGLAPASTLTNKAMRSRRGRANRFSPSGVFFKEVARGIQSSEVFPNNFKKLPAVGRGPDRLIPLFLSSTGPAKARWRKRSPCSGHSASRGGCVPSAGGCLQSQAVRKFRCIVALAAKYLVSNANGHAQHLFLRSSPAPCIPFDSWFLDSGIVRSDKSKV